MALSKTAQRNGTALLLLIAYLASRLPLTAKTLFEFDSVDFAVAAYRFDLSQVTPHMPGYIVHVLIGRWLNVLFHDINQAYVWESLLLGFGSLMFLWRAAAQVRGERVGIIAALLWLTTPLFWFYTEVATAYVHEAFFASAILYLGLRYINHRTEGGLLVWIGLFYSLAIGARQSSALFLAPAIIYLCQRLKPSMKVMLISVGVFLFATALWGAELLRESGGLEPYLSFAAKENIYKSQSLLFGNHAGVHVAMLGKLAVYLLSSDAPLLFLSVLGIVLFFPRLKRLYLGLRHNVVDVRADGSAPYVSPTAKDKMIFVFLVALTPMAFYGLVYFFKAGYLLNVLPSLTLFGAILLDQVAIWSTSNFKQRKTAESRLTRSVLSRYVASFVLLICILNVVWFLAPMPGKSQQAFEDAFTRVSLSEDVSVREQHAGTTMVSMLNRIFGFTSVQSILAMDRIHRSLITTAGVDWSHATAIDTYWWRWAYFYHPSTNSIELAGDADRGPMARSRCYHREVINSDTIELPSTATYLLMRTDHPAFGSIAKSVSLKALTPSQYLGLWQIEDSTFSLNVGKKLFVKRAAVHPDTATSLTECSTLFK